MIIRTIARAAVAEKSSVIIFSKQITASLANFVSIGQQSFSDNSFV